MKKLLLAAMVVLPAICACNGKTQGASGEKDSAVLAAGNVNNSDTDTSKMPNTAEASQAKNTTGLVIDENGVENLRIGMKRSQIQKSVPGLYDSFTAEENEVEGYIELYFEGKNGRITGTLEGDVIDELAFYIPGAVSSDGKLKVGMKLADAIASGSYSFVRYGFGLLEVEAEGSHFSFELPGDALTDATQNRFDEREGEDVIIKAHPDMVKPSAVLDNIVVY